MIAAANDPRFWADTVLLGLAVVFLRRLLSKLDRVYECVVGSPDKPGLVSLFAELQAQVAQIRRDIGWPADQPPTWPDAERRQQERRRERTD